VKRVVIYFNREEEDPISYDCDEGVEVRVINWQAIENNDPWQSGDWSAEDVEDLFNWGKGLVPAYVIESLRDIVRDREDK